MQTRSSTKRAAGIGLFVIVTVFGVTAVLLAIDRLRVADSTVALVAVATSAVVAVQSLEVQRRLEREKQLIERRNRLIESYRNVYERALQGEAPSEQEMRRFNVDLTFFGDEDAIKAWLDMRRAATSGEARPKVILPAQMKLVRAMRRNLGHADRNLTDRDLFGIILKNPDDLSFLEGDDSSDQ